MRDEPKEREGSKASFKNRNGCSGQGREYTAARMRAATAGLWKDVASGIGLGVGSGAMTAFLGARGGMTSFFGVRFVALLSCLYYNIQGLE